MAAVARSCYSDDQHIVWTDSATRRRYHTRNGQERDLRESVRADSHYTSRFRSVAERHRSVKFSHVYLNGAVHTERNVSVTSQFRSVAGRECLTWRNGSEPVCTCSILTMWTVLRLLHYSSVLACNECCLFLFQKMAPQMNLGYNGTAFAMQIPLQPGRQNLRNWKIRLHRPIWLHIIDSFLLD
jgi:hypothetical protein